MEALSLNSFKEHTNVSKIIQTKMHVVGCAGSCEGNTNYVRSQVMHLRDRYIGKVRQAIIG